MATPGVFVPNLLEGKVAFVTGGGSGICMEMTRAMMQYGANACIVGRTAAKLATAKAELESATGQQCMTVPCDVRDAKGLTEAMAACAARFGKIDIVVCGAAGNFLCPVVNLSFSAFKKVVEIDLVGTFNTCKASYEYLKKTQGLLLTISMTLHYTGMPLQAHACAAKSGIDALTRTLSNEWGLDGIRVNAIAPGIIRGTAGMDKLMPEAMEETMLNKIPLRRFGTRGDIADATLFLASRAASYVTGALFVVDGGAWMTTQGEFYPEGVIALSAKPKL